ncbi:hypothetical protein SAMN05421789_10923 [Kaistella chaponensis]|uniref:Uncharacterized protein n=1 Tax=Kaistella chaponensis TaxID=713588 RepID=A0A1N7MJP1_9FLAO|nr:hypothetical protein SAMN05421789_10923 [Kaistella chaponensis]
MKSQRLEITNNNEHSVAIASDLKKIITKR